MTDVAPIETHPPRCLRWDSVDWNHGRIHVLRVSERFRRAWDSSLSCFWMLWLRAVNLQDVQAAATQLLAHLFHGQLTNVIALKLGIDLERQQPA